MTTSEDCERENIHCTLYFCQVTIGNHLRGLEANTNLEASRTPVNKLDGTLRLECRNSSMHFLGYHVSAVEQASCHVLAVPRIAFDHLVVWLEARHGDLLYGIRLVLGLCAGDDRCVRHQGEMNSRIRDQVGLKFVEIDIKRAIEAERGGDGRNDYMRRQPIELDCIGVGIDLVQLDGSNSRNSVSRFPNSCDRCRKLLRCQP